MVILLANGINSPNCLIKQLHENVFVYGWVFISARGPPLVAVTEGVTSLWFPDFSVAFSAESAQALDIWASIVVGLQALEPGLQQFRGTGIVAAGVWNLPSPGIERLSPPLAGRSLPLSHQGRLKFTILKCVISGLQYFHKEAISPPSLFPSPQEEPLCSISSQCPISHSVPGNH